MRRMAPAGRTAEFGEGPVAAGPRPAPQGSKLRPRALGVNLGVRRVNPHQADRVVSLRCVENRDRVSVSYSDHLAREFLRMSNAQPERQERSQPDGYFRPWLSADERNCPVCA